MVKIAVAGLVQSCTLCRCGWLRARTSRVKPATSRRIDARLCGHLGLGGYFSNRFIQKSWLAMQMRESEDAKCVGLDSVDDGVRKAWCKPPSKVERRICIWDRRAELRSFECKLNDGVHLVDEVQP